MPFVGGMFGPTTPRDLYYNDTILLYNPADGLVDASPQAKTLTSQNTIVVDSTHQKNGVDTLLITGSNAGRIITNGGTSYLPTLLDNNEFCLEYWIYVTKWASAPYLQWCGYAPWGSTSGSGNFQLSMQFSNATNLTAICDGMSLDTWHHICIIRDNSNTSDTRLISFTDGAEASNQSIGLSTVTISDVGTLGAFIGYYADPDAPWFACAGARLTAGTTRYNVAGFTPDETPFPTTS